RAAGTGWDVVSAAQVRRAVARRSGEGLKLRLAVLRIAAFIRHDVGVTAGGHVRIAMRTNRGVIRVAAMLNRAHLRRNVRAPKRRRERDSSRYFHWNAPHSARAAHLAPPRKGSVCLNR